MTYINPENSHEQLRHLPEAPRRRVGVLEDAIRILESVPGGQEPVPAVVAAPAPANNVGRFEAGRQENTALDKQAIRNQLDNLFEEAA